MAETIRRVPEPAEGDYVLSPAPPLGSRTNVGIVEGPFVGTFDSDTEALGAILERMEAESYWPNVWIQDDHGGLRVLETLEG